jgi:hypothetical protein
VLFFVYDDPKSDAGDLRLPLPGSVETQSDSSGIGLAAADKKQTFACCSHAENSTIMRPIFVAVASSSITAVFCVFLFHLNAYVVDDAPRLCEKTQKTICHQFCIHSNATASTNTGNTSLMSQVSIENMQDLNWTHASLEQMHSNATASTDNGNTSLSSQVSIETMQDLNWTHASFTQMPPCIIETVSGYTSVSCGPSLLSPLSVLKPDRPAPDVVRLVTPHGQVCWLDKSFSQCKADDLHACKIEVDDCILRSASVNRLTSHVIDAAQFPPSTSLAVFLTGILKEGNTLDNSTMTLLAATYGIDDVYFFVHVWPEAGWSGSHEPRQLKADIEDWFQLHGLKKLQYHVMVDPGVQAGTCEGDKAWERCSGDLSKCDSCFQFCRPWEDVMLTRLQLLWDRVIFVESNRRSRFAYVMRLRTHTTMTGMLGA